MPELFCKPLRLNRPTGTKIKMNIRQSRLHISGLTPSISSNDLLSRFQSFGKVISFDGFGEHDANGNMRKFAFVTLEGSGENIRKCEYKTSHKCDVFLIQIFTFEAVIR